MLLKKSKTENKNFIFLLSFFALLVSNISASTGIENNLPVVFRDQKKDLKKQKKEEIVMKEFLQEKFYHSDPNKKKKYLRVPYKVATSLIGVSKPLLGILIFSQLIVGNNGESQEVSKTEFSKTLNVKVDSSWYEDYGWWLGSLVGIPLVVTTIWVECIDKVKNKYAAYYKQDSEEELLALAMSGRQEIYEFLLEVVKASKGLNSNIIGNNTQKASMMYAYAKQLCCPLPYGNLVTANAIRTASNRLHHNNNDLTRISVQYSNFTINGNSQLRTTNPILRKWDEKIEWATKEIKV